MKKLALAVTVLVVLSIVACTASAQNTITLGGSSNSMTFTGTGGSGWTLSLGGVTGVAFGSGEFSGDDGMYLFTQTGKITGTYEGGGLWDVSQGGTLTLTIGSLLSGTLELVDLGAGVTSTPTFNNYLAANLSGLSGSLAKDFPKGAILSITIDLASSTALTGLASGKSTTANISSGELNVPAVTPEPASMVLVGSGLLLLGGLVRRRRTSR
jgi:hypothetical protein